MKNNFIEGRTMSTSYSGNGKKGPITPSDGEPIISSLPEGFGGNGKKGPITPSDGEPLYSKHDDKLEAASNALNTNFEASSATMAETSTNNHDNSYKPPMA